MSRSRMPSLRTRAWPLLCIVWLTSCSLLRNQKMEEQRSATISPSRFQTVVVIAGDDARSSLRMSAMVRENLTKEGLQALRRAGRWDTEADALQSICVPGSAGATDGVLFVYYNRLILYDCESLKAAYDISGGSEYGVPDMARRLAAYLKSQAPPDSVSAPTP